MLVTPSDELAGLARQIGRQGKNDSGNFTSHGYNFVMPSVNAAIGCAQMEKIEEIIAERREMAAYLDSRLEEATGVLPALTYMDQKKVYQLYNIMCWDEDYRDGLKDHLESNDIPTRITYQPVHENGFYGERHPTVKLPVTRDVSGRILTLPFHLNLSDDEIDRIVDTVLEFDAS